MPPVLLRGAGLPTTLLAGLRTLPTATDTGLAMSEGPTAAWPAVPELESSLRASSEHLLQTLGRPLVREAIAWQNPGVLETIASMSRRGVSGPRNARWRDREHRLVRYLARYSTKAETIGFFGPLGHAELDPSVLHVEQRPGARLIGRRATFAEPWAVRRVAATLCEDAGVRPWLPVRMQSHHTLHLDADGTTVVVRPQAAPLRVSGHAATALRLAQERPLLGSLVDALAAKESLAWQESDAVVAELIGRRLLILDADIPLGPGALAALVARVNQVGEPQAKSRAQRMVDGVREPLDALDRAAGDPEVVAMAHLDARRRFEQSTGAAGVRKPGEAYAGRSVVFEECLRDTHVALGSEFAARLSPVLVALLDIARWITAATAAAYERALADRWEFDAVPLSDLWFDLLRMVHGLERRPLDDVREECHLRWRTVLAALPDAVDRVVRVDPATFATAVARAFPAPDRAGWRAGCVHSPDLQVCEDRPGGSRTGEYRLVLSEMHVATATTTGPVFEWHDPGAVSERLRRLGGPCVVPLYPDGYNRNTGRTMTKMAVPGDVVLCFTDVAGAPADAVSTADVIVRRTGDAFTADLPGGQSMPLLELLHTELSNAVIDSFRWLEPRGPVNGPRLEVGLVTVLRQSWTVELSTLEFVHAAGEPAQQQAAHRWRGALGLTGQIYVRFPGESKPMFVDFDAPALVAALVAAARSAWRGSPGKARGQDALVRVSEAHPRTDEAWVRDAEGRPYVGELRMVVLPDRDRDQYLGNS